MNIVAHKRILEYLKRRQCGGSADPDPISNLGRPYDPLLRVDERGASAYHEKRDGVKAHMPEQ